MPDDALDQQEGWAYLLEALDARFDVIASDLAGISLRVHTGPEPRARQLRIAMTPEEWADLWGVAHGLIASAVETVIERVDTAPGDVDTLTYEIYDLWPRGFEHL